MNSNSAVRSSPVKAGLILTALCAVGVGAFFVKQDPGSIVIVGPGVGGVVLALVVYGLILKRARQRKASPLERGVLSNSAASPYKISEPRRRAALDELRKKFEGGIAKFRAAGKDLYSLPWYVIVGEPGGGKTEAIRHCNVGFPPGLQDYTQGAGGTINMNWWFTNHAIFLDTAGRMMFEEVTPGTTGEWEQFLKLLVKVRPNCPVNGLLLVIPADSLIRDSADAIENKAANIARQLDLIQRTLGVRFPVFVVVTKCDLVNGFREFFDDLTDPQMQHQILGWSNPAPLDEAFNPELVDQHLRAVRERLVRRRQALLLDPVHTEDPTARRTDQVDALYALPDSFLKIAPRLRRYLEMIFVAGEWSPKPLFLRGIYFTSSMREGAALDAELAEALGVPVEQVRDDGRSWERERAYFLRDLFMIKVFREKGLVTRAGNTRRVQRRRKLSVVTVSVLGLVGLLVATWMGSEKLDESVGRQTRYWMAVNANWNDHRADWAIVQPVSPGPGAYRYNGGYEINLDETRTTLGQFFADASKRSQDQIAVPWIFRAQTVIQGDLNDQRRAAYRRLFDASVLAPTFEAARARFAALAADETLGWPAGATDALAELIRTELLAAGSAPPAREAHAQLDLDRLMRFVLPEDEHLRFKADDLKKLQEALEWMYAGDDAMASKWPPVVAGAGDPASLKTLSQAEQAMRRHWARRLKGQNPRLVEIRAVRQALGDFAKAEDAFFNAGARVTPGAATGMEDEAIRRDCLTQLSRLADARADVDRAMARLERGVTVGNALLALYEIEVDRDIEAAIRAHEKIVQQVPAPGAANVPVPLAAMRQSLTEAAIALPKLRAAALPEDLQNDLAIVDRHQFLGRTKGVDGGQFTKYQVHGQLYDLLIKQLSLPIPAKADTPESVRAAETIDREAADGLALIATVSFGNTGKERSVRLQQACDLAKNLLEWNARRRKQSLALVDPSDGANAPVASAHQASHRSTF